MMGLPREALAIDGETKEFRSRADSGNEAAVRRRTAGKAIGHSAARRSQTE